MLTVWLAIKLVSDCKITAIALRFDAHRAAPTKKQATATPRSDIAPPQLSPHLKLPAMQYWIRSIVALAVSLTAANFSEHASAEQIRLPATQDNSIVLVDGEWKENAGQQARIRAKGNQHIIAMAFDTSAIRGKRIQRATLVCTPSDQKIEGVTISTIATPWMRIVPMD